LSAQLPIVELANMRWHQRISLEQSRRVCWFSLRLLARCVLPYVFVALCCVTASPELVQSRKLYYHLAEAFRMSDQPEKALGAVERGLVVATSDADRAVYYVCS
jgi:hypothetical protein